VAVGSAVPPSGEPSCVTESPPSAAG
jgi:hypothetical protein